MVVRTAVGSSTTRSRALPPPAHQLVAQRSLYVRDSVVLASLGLGGGAMAGLLEHPQWSVGVAAAGSLASAVTMADGRLRQLRNAERDRLVEALAPLLSARALILDRRMVVLGRWGRGWPGVPRRVTLRYSPGAGADDPKWLSSISALVSQRFLSEFRVAKHDARRCRLVLRRCSSGPDSGHGRLSPTRERAERTITELIGPTAVVVDVQTEDEELVRITVKHEAGTRLAAAAYRARIERTISTVLSGRWRARWDLERDQVVFEVRPSFPDTVWMQPMLVDPSADILSTYDKVAIPFAVDEDGHEQLWRPAIDPNLLVVGAPGSGKTSTEHCILAGVANYNWPIWIVDGKGIEFLGFRSWPNVQVVATLVEQQVAVLERAWEVMEHRYQLIVNGEARKTDFEPLMVFLDEFADFRSNLLDWYAGVKRKGDPNVPPVLAKIASIARKGRSSRVHLLFATQRPDASYFGAGGVGGGDMRDNFRARVSMGRLSPQGAVMMWQDPSVGVALPRGKRGRATTINEDNQPVEIQGYRCPDPADPDLPVDQRQILARLRPRESVHERLLIQVPAPWLDPETHVEVEPSYREYVRANWVRASDFPEMDPEANETMPVAEARVLASPMTIFGLSGAQLPDGRRVSRDDAGSSSPELPLDAGTGPSAGVAFSPSEEDDRSYGPSLDVRPDADEISVGDLLLVDPDSEHWAVVDELPGDDPADPTCWAIPWRDDADEVGLLSVPDGERVTVRRAKEQ